jgi:hypothetical protein
MHQVDWSAGPVSSSVTGLARQVQQELPTVGKPRELC